MIEAPKMRAMGNGTANLITQELDYQLQLQRLTSGTIIKDRGPAIPILITGSFSGLQIRPDWSALVVSQAQRTS